MPTCVQLPAGTGWNRWRCNGKSLSPLAAPAFPRRSHSRQPARPDLRVCLRCRSVALPSALLYTFQGRRCQWRKKCFCCCVLFHLLLCCILKSLPIWSLFARFLQLCLDMCKIESWENRQKKSQTALMWSVGAHLMSHSDSLHVLASLKKPINYLITTAQPSTLNTWSRSGPWRNHTEQPGCQSSNCGLNLQLYDIIHVILLPPTGRKRRTRSRFSKSSTCSVCLCDW